MDTQLPRLIQPWWCASPVARIGGLFYETPYTVTSKTRISLSNSLDYTWHLVSSPIDYLPAAFPFPSNELLSLNKLLQITYLVPGRVRHASDREQGRECPSPLPRLDNLCEHRQKTITRWRLSSLTSLTTHMCASPICACSKQYFSICGQSSFKYFKDNFYRCTLMIFLQHLECHKSKEKQ